VVGGATFGSPVVGGEPSEPPPPPPPGPPEPTPGGPPEPWPAPGRESPALQLVNSSARARLSHTSVLSRSRSVSQRSGWLRESCIYFPPRDSATGRCAPTSEDLRRVSSGVRMVNNSRLTACLHTCPPGMVALRISQSLCCRSPPACDSAHRGNHGIPSSATVQHPGLYSLDGPIPALRHEAWGGALLRVT
jgi:hypothetical protein